MADVLKYNGANLLKAPARVLYAPYSTTAPTTPASVFDGTDPYAVKSGWVDFGATSGPPVLSRNITTNGGIVIEQTTTTLYEDPATTERTLQIPIAEFSPAILALLEESTVATYASGTKLGAGSSVDVGDIQSFTAFRLAVIATRSKAQGLVTETVGPKTRGAFVGFVAFNAALSGDNLQTSIGRTATADLAVTFKLYPDSANSNFTHRWLFENPSQSVT
jgi:hypothetical protein